jgi:hypothetical protein
MAGSCWTARSKRFPQASAAPKIAAAENNARLVSASVPPVDPAAALASSANPAISAWSDVDLFFRQHRIARVRIAQTPANNTAIAMNAAPVAAARIPQQQPSMRLAIEADRGGGPSKVEVIAKARVTEASESTIRETAFARPCTVVDIVASSIIAAVARAP